MTAALERGECSAASPGRTLPPGKTRYPLYRRLVGPQGRFGRTENLAPPGFDARTVQPVISRYTDWATRPTCIEIQVQNHFKRCNNLPREWKFSYSIKRFRELISIFTKSHPEVMSILFYIQFSLLSTISCSNIFSGRQPHQGVNVLTVSGKYSVPETS